MKLFIAGDYWSGTGPANVTYSLIQEAGSRIIFLRTRNKIFRAAEIFYKTLFSDAAVYSGFSLQNLLGFRLARIFHKPSFYLMHGSIYYEALINEENIPAMVEQEAQMLKTADFILAVSKPFEKWLKHQYPQYHSKIYTLTNGIDWNLIKSGCSCRKKISGQILSVGGGMPRKNILAICRAIELIYKEVPGCTIKLVVLGPLGRDSDAIRSYSFVEDKGIVSHEEALAYMAESQLFIQNSSFETFGLAPIEALLANCSLLITSHVGAASVMTALHEEDVIGDSENIFELRDKILFTLKNPNCTRILNGIDRFTTSVEYRQNELFSLVKELGKIK